MYFSDRQEAGRKLAAELGDYRGSDVVVYALPRGGVVLGYEVAQALGAPLDLVITRKIGHPENSEYAIGAITEEGEALYDEREKALVDRGWLERAAEKERREALRRRQVYLEGKSRASARGKRVIVVDDGVATGLTLRVALASLRKDEPRELIVAVPVAPHDIVSILEKEADTVVVLEDAEEYLGAVGAYYERFSQVSDEEVIDLLRKSRKAG